jgi:hypothetical protein
VAGLAIVLQAGMRQRQLAARPGRIRVKGLSPTRASPGPQPRPARALDRGSRNRSKPARQGRRPAPPESAHRP